MNGKHKILAVGVAGAVILIAGITTSVLATSQPAVPATTRGSQTETRYVATVAAIPTESDYQAWGCPMAAGDYSAVTGLLGLTADEITTQLQQGKSLVEIAAEKGVTEDQLVAAIMTVARDHMQNLGTSGGMTQEQFDQRLGLMEQHVRQLVNGNGSVGGMGCGGGMMGGGMMNGGTMNGSAGMMGGGGGMMNGSGGMMGGGMMGGWGTGTGSFGRGGMMGGSY